MKKTSYSHKAWVGNNKLLSESSWEFPPVKIYLAVNLLTCDTYLIWWKRLIKTIFRPIWRISSIFFNNEKKASKVWLAEESDDTLFRFPRHQKFPPLMSTRRPLEELFGSKLWTLWTVWIYKKRWNVARKLVKTGL